MSAGQAIAAEINARGIPATWHRDEEVPQRVLCALGQCDVDDPHDFAVCVAARRLLAAIDREVPTWPEPDARHQLDDHAPTCRRCAVLIALKIVESGSVYVPKDANVGVDTVLKIAAWIVGEDQP